MLDITENDRDEWRSARDHAYRTGADMTHPANCRCAQCINDEYDPADDRNGR